MKNRTTIESMEGSGRIRLKAKPSRNRSPNSRDGEVRLSLENRLRSLTSNETNPSQSQSRRNSASQWKSDESLTKQERRLLKKANNLNIYNVGWYSNFKFIMGEDPWKWFIPIGLPDSDGKEYRIDELTLRELRRITEEVRRGGEDRDDEEEDEEEETETNPFEDSTSSSNPTPSTQGYSASRLVANQVDVDLGRRPEPSSRKTGSKFQSAHGDVEWGEPPKRDFVLYGVDSDEEETGAGSNRWG